MFANGVSIWVVLTVVVGIYLLLTMLGRLSKKEAAAYLADGAYFVDVRTSEEFEGGKVEGSINIPVQQLAVGAKSELEDKEKVVLVFCLSGARASSAVGQLKRMGYRAYNVGGIGRARSVAVLSETIEIDRDRD